MKTSYVALIVVVLAISALAGCCSIADLNGQRAAQKQAAVDQCQQTYSSCQSQCEGYWLGGEKESCKNRCTNDYQVCMSYT